jgi:hypothetical protein
MPRTAIAALVAILFPAVAAPAGACAAPPRRSAGPFMVRIVRQKMESRYDLAWTSLYPLHQRVASLEAYVACESLVPSPGTLINVRSVRNVPESIRVSGRTTTIATRAVTVSVTVLSPLSPFPVRVVETFHAVPVSGHWTWILSPDQYQSYSDGACPYS